MFITCYDDKTSSSSDINSIPAISGRRRVEKIFLWYWDSKASSRKRLREQTFSLAHNDAK